ncbi:MAG: SgcJ/EcaC family oxidoreductase [Phycisphaera sp.]|nr:SgcJ/EcaC family oxidoreductase [Phycisphaera sp.]
MPDDQNAIYDLLKKYETALNQSDAGSAAKLYHPDGVFMPLGFPSSRGHEQVLAAYTGIFNTIQLKIAFTIDEIEVDHNTAIAVTRSEGTVKVRALGAEMPEANRELFVLRKRDGLWSIYRYMFNKTSGQGD